MKLSEFQKSIVRSIESGKVTDLESFISEFCDTQYVSYLGAMHTGIFSEFKSGLRGYLPDNQNKIKEELQNFIVVWNILYDLKLILVSDKPNLGAKVFPIFERLNDQKQYKPNEAIVLLTNKYYGKSILTLNSLTDFINRDFLSPEEYQYLDEKKEREKSQNLTRKIAYFTIGISIFITVATSIFNYITYTNQRKVTITNPEAFSDTINVKIIKNEEHLIDTIYIDPNNDKQQKD